MYRILVVDDEPAAIKHICNIISIKCPLFEVTGTAGHGLEALKEMEKKTPDVLITDVKMPVLDGIALIAKVKERYPQVLSLVVSGYHEFEYAKAAIKSGVCDYLLKPIKPSVLQNALNGLSGQLDEIYAKKRNLLMKSLCEKKNISQEELTHFFPAGRYHAAIVRKNGLSQRYYRNSEFEIFSGKDEKIYLYGRDEMEALYLYPEDILIYKSFYQVISETIRNEYRNSNFVTGIIRETPFILEDAAAVFVQLYQALDSSIIIGVNQILTIEEQKEEKQNETDMVSGEFRLLENYIRKGQKDRIIGAVGEQFAYWKQIKKNQMYVEAQVRYLLIQLAQYELLSNVELNGERLIDEIFYYAENMDKVSEAIQNFLAQNIKKEPVSQKKDTKEFFEKITLYIDRHLAMDLSTTTVCQEFGLSPTYLNKLFQKYSGNSYNKFLTLARIEYAKEIIEDEKIIYVKDVANRVGYSDQFYFSRIFTSVVGVCPSDYIERIQKGEK